MAWMVAIFVFSLSFWKKTPLKPLLNLHPVVGYEEGQDYNSGQDALQHGQHCQLVLITRRPPWKRPACCRHNHLPVALICSEPPLINMVRDDVTCILEHSCELVALDPW